QTLGLAFLQNRVRLDKSLLQTQLVLQTITCAAFGFGREDALGARGHLQLFLVFRIEDDVTKGSFNLARQLTHSLARRRAVWFECYRLDANRNAEIEQCVTTKSCLRGVIKPGWNDLEIRNFGGRDCRECNACRACLDWSQARLIV